MQGEPVAIPAPDAGDGVSPFSGSRDAHGPPDARAAAARRNSHAGPSLPVPIAGGIQINGYPQLYGSPPSPVDPQFSPPQGYFLARSPPGYFPAPGYVVPFGGQPFAQGYMVKGPMQMNMNMQPFPPQAGMPFQGGYPGPRAGPGIPPRVSPNPPSRAIPDGPEHESMGSVAFQQLSQGEGNRRSMSATPTAGMSGIGTRERVTSESAASDVTITGGPGAAASVSVSRKVCFGAPTLALRLLGPFSPSDRLDRSSTQLRTEHGQRPSLRLHHVNPRR